MYAKDAYPVKISALARIFERWKLLSHVRDGEEETRIHKRAIRICLDTLLSTVYLGSTPSQFWKEFHYLKFAIEIVCTNVPVDVHDHWLYSELENVEFALSVTDIHAHAKTIDRLMGVRLYDTLSPLLRKEGYAYAAMTYMANLDEDDENRAFIERHIVALAYHDEGQEHIKKNPKRRHYVKYFLILRELLPLYPVFPKY